MYDSPVKTVKELRDAIHLGFHTNLDNELEIQQGFSFFGSETYSYNSFVVVCMAVEFSRLFSLFIFLFLSICLDNRRGYCGNKKYRHKMVLYLIEIKKVNNS